VGPVPVVPVAGDDAGSGSISGGAAGGGRKAGASPLLIGAVALMVLAGIGAVVLWLLLGPWK
jgi:hypothetical protein